MAMWHVLFPQKDATKCFLHTTVANVFNITYKCKKLRQMCSIFIITFFQIQCVITCTRRNKELERKRSELAEAKLSVQLTSQIRSFIIIFHI